MSNTTPPQNSGQPDLPSPLQPGKSGSSVNLDFANMFSNPLQRWFAIATLVPLLVIIGSFGTWVSMWGFTTSGMEVDGIFTLLLGIGVMVVSALTVLLPNMSNKLILPIVSLVVTIFLLLTAMVNFLNVITMVRLGASIGWGMILVVLGTVGATVCVILGFLEALKANKPAGPRPGFPGAPGQMTPPSQAQNGAGTQHPQPGNPQHPAK